MLVLRLAFLLFEKFIYGGALVNLMVYFKSDDTLKGMRKNLSANPPFFRKAGGKSKKVFIDKGKSLSKVNPIKVGRLLGASLMIDLNSFVGMTETEIVFRPRIVEGGRDKGIVYFIDEKGEEVAFFKEADILKIVEINKDI